jgi:hypothetical protein
VCAGGIARCVEQINKVSRGQVSEEELKERQERAMADPEIQMILTDPIMRQVLNDFQSDPKAAQVRAQKQQPCAASVPACSYPPHTHLPLRAAPHQERGHHGEAAEAHQRGCVRALRLRTVCLATDCRAVPRSGIVRMG